MIDVSLQFIRDEINMYLRQKLNVIDGVKLDNISKVLEDSGAEKKIYLSLINLEEDRLSRNPDNFIKVDNKVVYKNPKLYLNVFCLFATNQNYEEGLKQLSLIFKFFQQMNVFTPVNNPALDPAIEKLVFELYSLNFEQLNQIWGMLGGKYYPSVLYKMRVISIDEMAVNALGEPIKEIEIIGKDYTG
ncbi:MAG TPA: DUF4255 domain-containing protein [Ignavibacteria bacterium]|nr:DUF4255 domain-containing protein [Ignavibacteria bacterium]HMR39482.1 DUF4255 domain-containing protein [Ignavibacteria bacterium]